jgi:hypothetical protein
MTVPLPKDQAQPPPDDVARQVEENAAEIAVLKDSVARLEMYVGKICAALGVDPPPATVVAESTTMKAIPAGAAHGPTAIGDTRHANFAAGSTGPVESGAVRPRALKLNSARVRLLRSRRSAPTTRVAASNGRRPPRPMASIAGPMARSGSIALTGLTARCRAL